MNNTNNRSISLESAAFYSLLFTIIIVPISFWGSQYFALDAVKTIFIAIGTIVSASLLLFGALRAKEIHLPPKAMLWIGGLMAVSVIGSSVGSGHFAKSFFGQGFELGTGSMILILFVLAAVVYRLVAKRVSHVPILYVGIVAPFLLVYLFQVLRFLFGPGFISLGFLNTVTATMVGNWYSLAMYAGIVAMIALLAVIYLPLSRRLRTVYWVLVALSGALMFLVNSWQVWEAAALVLLGLTIHLSLQKPKPADRKISSFLRRLAWIPLVACVVSALLAYKGVTIAGPIINKFNAGYSELSLPWQMTIDVAAGELKDKPILGSGPNRFSQAFLTHKPSGINVTDAWGVEFNTGFGLIPTFLVTQGLLGGIVWILFFVLYGILGVRSLRNPSRVPQGSVSQANPSDQSYARFVLISSYTSATFLWLVSLVYVPSHALVFLAFILTGIWLGAAVAYGRLRPVDWVTLPGSRSQRLVSIVTLLCFILAIVWGVVYLKNTAALAYFGGGVKTLTLANDPAQADAKFRKAIALNPLDVYWQARAEANISIANSIAASVTASSNASTSQAAALKVVDTINQAFSYANNAIGADRDNYYNYVSQARVAELAANLNMTNAYDTALGAYTNAINLNPQNPSIYINLARLYASKGQFDSAIQAIGASLQVKNNYLDAVFLLSQVEAAKGNLPNAITAADFATKLNPANPLVFFQLGLLQYTKGDYRPSIEAFGRALTIEPNYANASYFLGLAYARVGEMAKAIGIFSRLAEANPDNADVSTILSTMRSGKPLFSGATKSVAAPESKAKPPLPSR
ncbi:MAG: tetratricopeptide repeat protein [Candidatus Paceibacterota bacterium]